MAKQTNPMSNSGQDDPERTRPGTEATPPVAKAGAVPETEAAEPPTPEKVLPSDSASESAAASASGTTSASETSAPSAKKARQQAAQAPENITISWVLPPDIIEGTLLDGKLLNAEAVDGHGNKVPGRFEYEVPGAPCTPIYTVNADGTSVLGNPPYVAQEGELLVKVYFSPDPTLSGGAVFNAVTAIREAYVQPKDPDDLPAKPKTNLRASWSRLLCDPSIPGAVAQLIQTSGNQRTDEPGGPSTQQRREHVIDHIAKAIKGSDAIKAAAEPPTGELVVEVRVVNEAGKEEPLTRESLKTFQLQVLDKYQSLAATRQIVEEGRIRFPSVKAGSFILALSAENAGPDGDIDNVYEVRIGDSGEFKKCTRRPYWQKTTEVVRETGAPDSITDANGIGREEANLDRLRSSQFHGHMLSGQATFVKLKLIPRTARVRCFSTLTDDGCGCSTGKRYIAQVPVSVMKDEVLLHSNSTGNSGGTAFKLSPGWYTFSAPPEITIEGCKYALCSSSPVWAYVDPRQSCSDIHFCYGRKGTEIQVGTFVFQTTTADPNSAMVEDPLPEIQYLLLREGDDTFAQQQLDSGGGAVFSGLSPGTYWLFFQAPATYKSLPIKPVNPRGGRMTITTFAGQMRPIPVHATYTSMNAVPPAEFNGYVRDADGNPMPQQLVKIVNSAGVAVAAALTDAQGYYSILIYEAENLQIVFGAQKQSVSASQISLELKVTPALTRPPLARELAQATQDTLLTQGL